MVEQSKRLTKQTHQCNIYKIVFKVFYNCIGTLVICVFKSGCSFLYIKNILQILAQMLLMLPTKMWGHSGRVILHMAGVFLNPPRGVLFEIRTTRMIRIMRTEIIDYGLSEHFVG